MPLVVTRLGRDRVEVWGQVRPADGRVRPAIEIARGTAAGAVVGRPLTNAAGYYRFVVTRRGAASLRYRASWTDPNGEELLSRVAAAGQPIGYRE